MLPIVLAGLAIAGGLYFMSRGKPAGGLVSPGSLPTEAGQSAQVQGKSGKYWLANVASVSGSMIYVDLYAAPEQFGPHTTAPVLQYVQTGADKASRSLVKRYEGMPDVAYQTALSDFGIKA